MTEAPHGYQPGRPKAVCDRCGFTYRLDELVTEWTGLKVCRADLDPPPRDMAPPRIVPEGLPIPGARPEPSFARDFIVDNQGIPIGDTTNDPLESDD